MKTPKQANIFMFLLFIFLLFLANLKLFILTFFFPFLLSNNNAWIYQSIYSIFCFIVPILLYMGIKKVKFNELIPLAPLKLKNFFLISFLGFAIQPTLNVVAVFTTLFHEDEISNAIYSLTNIPYYKSLFTIAIIPAITEELAFRGVILTGYKKSPLLVGVVMSAFYFGIMHLTITQLFYTIVGGIIFALVVKVTKSIYAGMLMHFILNGTQFTLAYILSKFTPGITEEITNSQTSNLDDFLSSLVGFGITLPFLLLSIFLFIYFNKEEINALKEENRAIKNSKNKPKVFTIFFFINILIWLMAIIIINILR